MHKLFEEIIAAHVPGERRRVGLEVSSKWHDKQTDRIRKINKKIDGKVTFRTAVETGVPMFLDAVENKIKDTK